MPMKVKIKRRKPSLASLPEKLRKEQMRHAKRAVALYKTSTDGWQEGPTFAVQQIDGDPMRLNIYARGSEELVDRYSWIDGGFERKVAMESGFIAKSTPGVLRQGPGSGYGYASVASGAKSMLPVPKQVIKREFTRLVAEGIRDDYFAGMAHVFRRHFRK